MREVKGKLALVFVLVSLLSACGDTEEVQTFQSVWWLTETPGDASSLQIDVSVGSGSCNSFNRVELNETDAEVEVLAYSDSDVSQDECTDNLVLEKSTISLEAPLGDRTLKGCIPPAATESLAVRDLTEDCLTVR